MDKKKQFQIQNLKAKQATYETSLNELLQQRQQILDNIKNLDIPDTLLSQLLSSNTDNNSLNSNVNGNVNELYENKTLTDDFISKKNIFKWDVFSLGVVFAELMYSIDKNDEIAYDLISKMIHPFYWERYTIEDCLKHNFFNSSSETSISKSKQTKQSKKQSTQRKQSKEKLSKTKKSKEKLSKTK